MKIGVSYIILMYYLNHTGLVQTILPFTVCCYSRYLPIAANSRNGLIGAVVALMDRVSDL